MFLFFFFLPSRGLGASADLRGSDEAEGVIAMISDWLELDAEDNWVRHDSEIVSVHHFL